MMEHVVAYRIYGNKQFGWALSTARVPMKIDLSLLLQNILYSFLWKLRGGLLDAGRYATSTTLDCQTLQGIQSLCRQLSECA